MVIKNKRELKQVALAEKVKEYMEDGKPLVKAELLDQVGMNKGSINVFKTEDFNQILNKILPDSLVLKVHKKLLESKFVERRDFPSDMDMEDINKICSTIGKVITTYVDDVCNKIYCWIATDNTKALTDGLDLVYKLKGSYAPEKHMNFNQDFSSVSDEELDALVMEQLHNKERYDASLKDKRVVDIKAEKTEKVDKE